MTTVTIQSGAEIKVVVAPGVGPRGLTGAALGIATTSYDQDTGVLTVNYIDGTTFQTGDLRGKDANAQATDLVPLADEIIVNADGSSARQAVSDLGTQLLGSTAIGAAINAVEQDLSAARAAYDATTDDVVARLDTVEVRQDTLDLQQTTNNVIASDWSQLSATTPTIVGQGAEIPDQATGTHADPATALIVPDAGRYRGYDTVAGAWTRVADTGLSAKANKLDVDALHNALRSSFDTDMVTTAIRVGGAYYDTTNGAYDWGIGLVGGVDVAAGTVFDAVRFALGIDATTTQVRYRLWSRPIGAAWMDNGPGYTGDTQHGSTVTVSPADIGIIAGGDRGAAVFLLSEMVTIESDRLYIHEIEALDAGGNQVKSGIEYKLVTGLTTDQYRKWRRALPSPASWSNQVTSTTYVYCYDLMMTGYAVKPDADYVAPQIVSASSAVDGLSISVAARCSDAGLISEMSATVTLDAATGGSVTDEPITLNPAAGAAITYGYLTDRTAHADLRSVVVKDASTMDVLVKGTDYWAIEELGAFSLVGTSGTPRAVLISYQWSRMRYDLIHYSPATGAIAVTKGTERERDQSEFVPAAPVGAIPLFHVHVRSGGNIAVPVWDVAEGVRRSRRGEVDEETSRNRRLLRPVLRKLRAGQPVKIVSYGDSNFAQMGGPYNLAAVRSTANTIYHDRTKDMAGLLQSPAYGADVLATIPTYDTGDGAGAVHTRFGVVWELIRALEAGYASAITYENRSIPGTNSTTATYHGQDSVRLAAATGSGADIAIIGFGQNELGQSYTRANIMSICAAFINIGTMPIVMGCFRPHAADFHAFHTVANWAITQRHLREAALAADCPHVSMLTLYADGETGPLGLSPYDLCAATKDVHPGIREHRVIGSRLAASFD